MSDSVQVYRRLLGYARPYRRVVAVSLWWRLPQAVNPVEFLTRSTGTWALVGLLATLAVSPLRQLSGWAAWLRAWAVAVIPKGHSTAPRWAAARSARFEAGLADGAMPDLAEGRRSAGFGANFLGSLAASFVMLH